MKKIYPRVIIRKRGGLWWSHVVPYKDAPEEAWVRLTYGMYRFDVRNWTQRLLTGEGPRFVMELSERQAILAKLAYSSTTPKT